MWYIHTSLQPHLWQEQTACFAEFVTSAWNCLGYVITAVSSNSSSHNDDDDNNNNNSSNNNNDGDDDDNNNNDDDDNNDSNVENESKMIITLARRANI